MTQGHWYPQNTFLEELIDYVYNTYSQTKSELEQLVLGKLKENDYPYILVDFIVKEGLLRRRNNQ